MLGRRLEVTQGRQQRSQLIEVRACTPSDSQYVIIIFRYCTDINSCLAYVTAYRPFAGNCMPTNIFNLFSDHLERPARVRLCVCVFEQYVLN